MVQKIKPTVGCGNQSALPRLTNPSDAAAQPHCTNVARRLGVGTRLAGGRCHSAGSDLQDAVPAALLAMPTTDE